MLQLLEHQVGFSEVRLGFPSIQGCMAIVYVTQNGLFGYHNYGGSASDKWAVRATAFAQFVNAHGSVSPGTRLYGATFVGSQRGYSGVAKSGWAGELKAFASKLNFSGGIRGINLDNAPFSSNANASAYVEFVKVGDKCRVYVKQWNDAFIDHNQKQTRLAPDPNFKLIKPGATATVDDGVNGGYYNSVNSSGVTVMHSERL